MKTGRPPVKRTRKTLQRDIATMRRLKAALQNDSELDARAAIASLDKTITELQQLSGRI